MGNEYTAFGTAIHDVCESVVLDQVQEPQALRDLFELRFLKHLQGLPSETKDNLNKELVSSMRLQAPKIIPEILPALDEYFDSYEVISSEEKLFVPIQEYSDQGYSFKGFIDLVVKTADGKYHIIDWKTCSWGWASKKKAEPMTTYQLIFYKHYFALKHGIDPANIETHFALLKRTAKKNYVELFRVTSGKIKSNNAIKLLVQALYNITNGKYIKNRLACRDHFGTCDFYKTKHCR
jgi:hypothetical protein